MAGTGTITITPGYLPADGEQMNNAKFRQVASPVGVVDANSIGSTQLVATDIRSIVTTNPGATTVVDRNTDTPPLPGSIQSADYVQGVFGDGVLVVGSTTFTSDTALFSAGDVGRYLIAQPIGGATLGGIPGGSTIVTVNDNRTVTLSKVAQGSYPDGITATDTSLLSGTANFTTADVSRTVTGPGILAGTTITGITNSSTATLSQATTATATGVLFQVLGRPFGSITFNVLGRGRGWKLAVDAGGVGTLETYAGVLNVPLAVGGFSVAEDGTLSIGTGTTQLIASPDGTFVWGNTPNTTTINKSGQLFIGASTFAASLFGVDANGNVMIPSVATRADNVATDILNPFVQDVIATPPGGAIVNPTNASLNSTTRYSRIYYRSVAKDGVSNTDSSWVSATGAFTIHDVGKLIVGDDIPDGTLIKTVTNATTIVLTANTVGTGTGREFYIVPDVTDTLYSDGNPIPLTVTTKIAARAYKNGEYSVLRTWLFDTAAGSTTVQNPKFDPIPATYGGSTLTVTISNNTAASMQFYTKDGTTPVHDGSFAAGATFVNGIANGTTTFTDTIDSPFLAVHVGALITGTNIHANTTVAGYTSATQITLSRAATGSGTNPFTLGGTTVKINAASGTCVLPSGTTILSAIGVKSGLTDSGETAGSYIVTTGSGTGGGGGGTGGGGGHSRP